MRLGLLVFFSLFLQKVVAQYDAVPDFKRLLSDLISNPTNLITISQVSDNSYNIRIGGFRNKDKISFDIFGTDTSYHHLTASFKITGLPWENEQLEVTGSFKKGKPDSIWRLNCMNGSQRNGQLLLFEDGLVKKRDVIPPPKIEKPRPVEIDEDRIFTKVELNTSFPEGKKALREYLKKHIHLNRRIRRKVANDSIFLMVTVDEYGKLSAIKTEGKTRPALKREIIRVLQNGPDWWPSIQNGLRVKAWYQDTIIIKEIL